MRITSKSSLAVFLSKLEDFKETNVKLEQYSTPSEICASMLWAAYMSKDISGKIILDAACGPGFFGIGALLLGAEKVYFVDVDNEAIEITKRNLKTAGIEKDFELMNIDIAEFDKKVDVVLQNPPFGTKTKHIDKLFLEVAFEHSDVIYSIHKKETKEFIEAISKDHNFKITHYQEYNFMLRKTMKFHRKNKTYITVGCWRFQRI